MVEAFSQVMAVLHGERQEPRPQRRIGLQQFGDFGGVRLRELDPSGVGTRLAESRHVAPIRGLERLAIVVVPMPNCDRSAAHRQLP